MFKRFLACVLVLTMSLTMVSQAQAARLENAMYLSPVALTSDDNVWREFSNFVDPVKVTLRPREWYITPAFHAIDGWVVSYSGFSAESSDPEVATASIQYTGASPVAGRANSFIGLGIFGKKPGTAVITVSYAVFVTNSKYNDKRSTPYYTKTFYVTVEDCTLDVDVAFSTNEVVLESAQGYLDKYDEVKDNIFTDSVEGVVGFVSGAMGAAADFVANLAVNYHKGDEHPIFNAYASTVEGQLYDASKIPFLGAVVQAARTMSNLWIDKNDLEGARLLNISSNPNTVYIDVRISNPCQYTAEYVKLYLRTTNASFTGYAGPWNDMKVIDLGNIPAYGTVTKRVAITPYPKINNQNSSLVREAYTATVSAQCAYGREYSIDNFWVEDAAEMTVYSAIGNRDRFADPYEGTIASAARTTAIMCPVDVNIMDKAGNVLATLTTGGESFTDGVVAAGSVDDMKYFMVPPEKQGEYQLQIVAVDNGQMNVVGMDTGDATNMVVYESVELHQGDSFLVDLTQDIPAAISAQLPDGTLEALTADLTLNESSIASALEQTDVSESMRAKVAHAMALSLVPAEVLGGSFQSEITLEQYCRLMLALMEKQLDMVPGELTDMYLAENPEVTPVSVPMAVAVSKGLLDMEYADTAMTGDASSRLLTADEVLMMLNNFRYTMQWDGNFSYDYLPLSLENMIGMVEQMWVVLDSQGKNVVLAEAFAEEVRGEMVEARVPGTDYVLLYREGETQKSLLRDSVFLLPVSSKKVDDISSISDTLLDVMQFQFDAALAGDLPGRTIDTSGFQQQDRSFVIASIGMDYGEDDQGWTYLWAPFYFVNQDDSIFKNTVYLVMFRSAAEPDTETAQRYGISAKGDNRWEAYIVADQDRVGAFLAEQVLLERLSNQETTYAELKRDSKGDEVIRLQEALIEHGWLEGEATGVYDGKTQQAVHGLQQQLGLKTTGVADNDLQRILFDDIIFADLALEDWLAPYISRAELKQSVSSSSQQMVHIINPGSIREQAVPGTKVLKDVQPGETYVCLGQEDNGWYHLMLEDGREGYLHNGLAEMIE